MTPRLQGLDAEVTYQLIHGELALDGSPGLNLASFVNTWMPPGRIDPVRSSRHVLTVGLGLAADKLMMENISKNLIDQDEYPMTRKLYAAQVNSVYLIVRGSRTASHAL